MNEYWSKQSRGLKPKFCFLCLLLFAMYPEHACLNRSAKWRKKIFKIMLLCPRCHVSCAHISAVIAFRKRSTEEENWRGKGRKACTGQLGFKIHKWTKLWKWDGVYRSEVCLNTVVTSPSNQQLPQKANSWIQYIKIMMCFPDALQNRSQNILQLLSIPCKR